MVDSMTEEQWNKLVAQQRALLAGEEVVVEERKQEVIK